MNEQFFKTEEKINIEFQRWRSIKQMHLEIFELYTQLKLTDKELKELCDMMEKGERKELKKWRIQNIVRIMKAKQEKEFGCSK